MTTEMNQKMERVKKIIGESKYLVCLKGRSISAMCGCWNYRSPEAAYEVEEKYGHSPEEMYSGGFYNTRVKEFYQFYQDEMIADLGTVPEGLKTLAHLEEKGILKSIVTRDIFSLAKRAGCKNVLELHGSVYRNQCPHCHQEYGIEYIQNAKGVPKCSTCGTTIRPQIHLLGEIVDNALVTRAADEVMRADVLLILGCRMNAYMPNMLLRYFNGRKVILINQDEHYKDRIADIRLYGNPMDILTQLDI